MMGPLIIWLIVIIWIASKVRKGKAQQAKPGGAGPQPVQPQKAYRPPRPVQTTFSSAGAQQLAEAMRQARAQAAARGAAWAQRLMNEAEDDPYEEPAEVKADPNHTHEGAHLPLAPSEEGAYSQQSMWIEEREQGAAPVMGLDPCRVVGGQGEESLLSTHRATRRAGSVSGQRHDRAGLAVNAAAVRQGIIWKEILEGRGGRRGVR